MESSAAADSEGRYARLASLIVEEGTSRIKMSVLRHLQPNCGNPHELLRRKKKLFQRLHHQRYISSAQLDVLYPPNGSASNTSTIDMSLWFILARYVTVRCDKLNWNSTPEPEELDWQHDVLRVKQARNVLFHLPSTDVDSITFDSMWAEVSAALMRLGTTQEMIEIYLTRPLDSAHARRVALQVREQVHEELHNAMLAQLSEKRRICVTVTLSICVALLVAGAVVAPIVIVFKPTTPCEDLTTTHSVEMGVFKLMRRSRWDALPPKYPQQSARWPVPNVVMMHTAYVASCKTCRECIKQVQNMQKYHQNKMNFSDIKYNYLVGGDFVVYEGVGMNYVADAANYWDQPLLSIALMGNFLLQPVPIEMLETSNVLIDYLVNATALDTNHSMYGHCQIDPVTYPYSPGAMAMKEIRCWPNWVATNYTKCKGRPYFCNSSRYE